MVQLKQLTTKKIALIAIFSALYYVLSFLPALKIIGGMGTSTSVNLEAFMASIFGLVLGPYLGALTAFMGAFVAWILPPGTPSLTSVVFLPAPVINAFIVGLIYSKKWKRAFIVLSIVIFAFWFLPPSQPWNQFFHIGLYVMWDKILALALIIPTAIFLKRSVRMTKNIKEATMEKIDLVFVLSLAAAILILLNAWIIGSGRPVKHEFKILGTTFKLSLVSNKILPTVSSFGYLWLLLGIGILICTVLLYFKPEKRAVWSFIILVLSCASTAIGGGLFVGLLLGVLGGIFGTFESRLNLPRINLFGEMSLYFLLAFIGNEADNALAADIFAIPLVYEGIFQFPLIALRASFELGLFLYFGIRLFQAVITTLIATPLLKNLKAAGFDISQITDEKSKLTKTIYET